ncbi:MAG: hypothetical protein CMA64_10555 [Euryarchaeota archaeon]|nr:hypothetical protein [Euryarchaeota archaeon]
MKNFLNYLALGTSLAIAGIAAYFSVIGLATIFAGAALGVIIMTGVLEFGKIVTAAYLHLFWDKLNYMKYYLTASVVVLMLITSLGIFGYLAKASSDTSYATGIAQSEVARLDTNIERKENQIELIEGRIEDLSTGGVDVTDSVNAQIEIRDGAWDRVQGDIDYAQGQINALRSQLTALDDAVNELRSKGVETITTDEGGVFQSADVEIIDYVAQADALFQSQSEQREQIRNDIKEQQDNIDKYRQQAQDTIDGANGEINRLQDLSTGNIDDILVKTDEYNTEIDSIYDEIQVLKDDRFVYEQEILGFEAEIGPIKYVAEVIYGQEESVKYLDNAVRWVIFALIFVFDPLAVLLLITSTGLIVRKIEEDKPKVVENRYVIQVPKNKVPKVNKTT